jgi:hypothetical protein
MSIWNKVLLGLLFIASLVFFHAAILTVKTFYYWSNLANSFEGKLKQVREDIVQLRTADHDHPLPNKTFGVQQLRLDLGRMVSNRGRIWANCQMKKVLPEVINGVKSGRTEVNVSSDDPGPLIKTMWVWSAPRSLRSCRRTIWRIVIRRRGCSTK